MLYMFSTPEPYIRIGVLNNLAGLLDRNSEFSEDGEETVTENEERLFDVPIMMLTDINQQVSLCHVTCAIQRLVSCDRHVVQCTCTMYVR